MFKGKVYLYKNMNWKEERVEKDFNNQKDFEDYVNRNPELKKLESSFEEVKFPKSFDDMKRFFDEMDKKLFWKEEKKSIFDELSDDFNRLYEKSKKLIGKK